MEPENSSHECGGKGAVTVVGVVLTIVVLIGVAVLILLMERKRARQIEHDVRQMAHDRDAQRHGAERSSDRSPRSR